MPATKPIGTPKRTAHLRLIDGTIDRGVRLRERRPVAREHRESPLMLFASIIMLLALALMSLHFEQVSATRATSRLNQVATTEIVVSAGESLWSIACDHAVEGVGTQQLVDWLIETNGLAGADLTQGECLTVPASHITGI